MKKRLSAALLAAATSFLAPHAASAAVLALWNFSDGDGVVDTSLPGVMTTTFTSPALGTGTSDLKITNFEAQGGSSEPTAGTRYWEVSLSNTPFGLFIESLSFGARVYQQPGLRNGFVVVRGSTDGFTASLSPTPSAVTSGSLTTITVPLGLIIQPGVDYTSRIYLVNDPSDQASNLEARLALDNVTFNGTLPEPSTLALAALVGAGFVFGSVRRRRAR